METTSITKEWHVSSVRFYKPYTIAVVGLSAISFQRVKCIIKIALYLCTNKNSRHALGCFCIVCFGLMFAENNWSLSTIMIHFLWGGVGGIDLEKKTKIQIT